MINHDYLLANESTFYTSGMTSSINGTSQTFREKSPKQRKSHCSPNPKGCPPIRTIFQSSPEALVKRTLLGNLEERKNVKTHFFPFN